MEVFAGIKKLESRLVNVVVRGEPAWQLARHLSNIDLRLQDKDGNIQPLFLS